LIHKNTLINEYKNGLTKNRIIGALCPKCETKFLLPRPICNVCNNNNLEHIELSGKGVVIGFTQVAVVPTKMSKIGFSAENPYWTCIVALEEGINIPAVLNVTGIDSFKQPFIGMKVSAVFGRENRIYFEPI